MPKSIVPTGGDPVDLPDLTADEAVALTERIRQAIEHTWQLLAEAHARKAYAALGYGTFGDYVGEEFGWSRQHAYKILDQAQVIQALEEATGVSHACDISVRAAQDIKGDLPGIIDAVAEEVAEGVEPGEAVKRVVARVRPPRPEPLVLAKRAVTRAKVSPVAVLLSFDPADVASALAIDEVDGAFGLIDTLADWVEQLRHALHTRVDYDGARSPDPADNLLKKRRPIGQQDAVADAHVEEQDDEGHVVEVGAVENVIGPSRPVKLPQEVQALIDSAKLHGWRAAAVYEEGAGPKLTALFEWSKIPAPAVAKVTATFAQPAPRRPWGLVGGFEANGDPLTPEEVREALGRRPTPPGAPAPRQQPRPQA